MSRGNPPAQKITTHIKGAHARHMTDNLWWITTPALPPDRFLSAPSSCKAFVCACPSNPICRHCLLQCTFLPTTGAFGPCHLSGQQCVLLIVRETCWTVCEKASVWRMHSSRGQARHMRGNLKGLVVEMVQYKSISMIVALVGMLSFCPAHAASPGQVQPLRGGGGPGASPLSQVCLFCSGVRRDVLWCA